MILEMYLTLSSLILAGISNMVFTKTKLYKNHNKPIDCGKDFIDNKRLLGDNKTWIGFLSMIVFSIIFQLIISAICNMCGLNQFNDFYNIYDNTLPLNILIGFLIGFTYMICELPNSFLKRRINIEPGKTTKGIKGILFFIIDQIDSLIGVVFIVYLFSGISITKCLCYILLGAITHIFINVILRLLKIRKNI